MKEVSTMFYILATILILLIRLMHFPCWRNDFYFQKLKTRYKYNVTVKTNDEEYSFTK